jgi:hypothetical protein
MLLHTCHTKESLDVLISLSQPAKEEKGSQDSIREVAWVTFRHSRRFGSSIGHVSEAYMLAIVTSRSKM